MVKLTISGLHFSKQELHTYIACYLIHFLHISEASPKDHISEASSKGLMIGCVIGGVVIVFMLIVIITYCYTRRGKQALNATTLTLKE